MFDKPGREEFGVSADKAGGKITEPLHTDNIHRVSLQTKEGKILIGVPVTVGATGIVPRILLTPVRAAICATAMVAKVAKLKIVVEREAS